MQLKSPGAIMLYKLFEALDKNFVETWALCTGAMRNYPNDLQSQKPVIKAMVNLLCDHILIFNTSLSGKLLKEPTVADQISRAAVTLKDTITKGEDLFFKNVSEFIVIPSAIIQAQLGLGAIIAEVLKSHELAYANVHSAPPTPPASQHKPKGFLS
jgi:hypothetical protein